MNAMVIGFWGAFFGTVVLMLAGALFAFARSLRRVALTAALSALVSALFAVAYLGWLPLGDPATETRVLAHVATACSTVLGLMLLAMLGLLREAAVAGRIRVAMLSLAAGVAAAGWAMSPAGALALSSVMAFGVGLAALGICVRSALRGDRLAWAAVLGVLLMLTAVAGLSWIALDRERVPAAVHLVSAGAGMAYLATMACVLWARYSYLIELREVMAHGPSYDPVTRMRSHAETGLMLGDAFTRSHDDTRSVGLIVVSVGNLYALEKLHGLTAVNHALFVCATRLRRCVPADVKMGRLSDDGFLLLIRNPPASQALIRLARQVALRLVRPVVLGTSLEPSQLDAARTQWVADVGIGVLQAPPQVRPAQAVAMGRAMSRTAWSYASRVAWYDHAAGQIAELPADEPA
jgi:GGDEF domain-containing protein